MSKDKLIPQLRFPEFKNKGEWEEKKLGEIAENVMYGMNSAAVEFDGINKYIRITDIDENTRTFTPNPVTSPDGQLDDKYLLRKGDILFTRTGASVGKSYIHQVDNEKIYFAGFLIRFSILEEVPYFIYAQTLTEQYQRWVVKTSMRSGQPGINAEEYKSFSIYLPPTIQEQQKIAACLSSLDEVIAAHSQKLDLLKEHKKGLMQNLFPQEAETVPKVRFKEFVKDGEWVEKKLGEVCSIKSGSTPLRSDDSFYKGGTIPWVKTTDLNNGFIFETEEKITELAKAKLNLENSVLVAMYGGFNQIGRTGYLKVSAATNQALSVLNSNESILNPLFLLMWLNAKVDLWKNFAGSSRKDPNITGSDVAVFPISLPTIQEQQKIASCLSSLDALITAEAEKIAQLKQHKKGVMQGLFPKIND